MFRNKVKGSLFFPGGKIFESVRKVKEDGSTVVHIENSARVLPSSELYDLKTMLKAGVKLQQVNTKIVKNNDFIEELPQEQEIENKELEQ